MLRLHCTPENMKKPMEPTGKDAKEDLLRLCLQGFFWCPRDLFGIEDI